MLRPPGGCCCPAVGCQLSLSIQLRQCCSTTGGASSTCRLCISRSFLWHCWSRHAQQQHRAWLAFEVHAALRVVPRHHST